MALVRCNMQFVSNLCKVQRTSKLCGQQVQQKLLLALQFAAEASIYRAEETVIDLSVSQAVLLSVIYGLLDGDVGFCLALIDLSDSLVQLKSSFFRVWLRDDFDFAQEDVVGMFSKLSEITESGLLQLPHNVFVSFSSLIDKYDLAEHFSKFGDARTLRLIGSISNLVPKRDKLSENRSGIPETSRAVLESFTALSEEEIQLHLRKAVHANDLIRITALVEAGANIDDELENGDTLLHLAVSNTNVEAVQSLLRLGAIPNWRNRDYITPLQMAVGLNSSSIVEALVQSGAEVNQRSTEGCTLMHEAAAKGNTEVLKVLVRQGASIDNKNISGQTPLHLAIKGNHLETVEALVEVGANVNIMSNDGEAPIHIAVSAGYPKILKSLIRSGADLNVKTTSGMTVLHLAANRHIVKLLTTGGADINIISDCGETPLHLAASNGCIEIAKAFIASNAIIDSLNYKKASPLSVAVKAEHSEMVRLLVASGADVNFKDKEDYDNSLLHWAVQEEKLNCVKLLLDAGADVNILNNHKNTPLHYAAHAGNLTITELLLNKGANINVFNNLRNPPYSFAALNGHLQVAQLLLDKGARTSFVKIHDLGLSCSSENKPSNGGLFCFGALQTDCNKSPLASSQLSTEISPSSSPDKSSNLQGVPRSLPLFTQPISSSSVATTHPLLAPPKTSSLTSSGVTRSLFSFKQPISSSSVSPTLSSVFASSSGTQSNSTQSSSREDHKRRSSDKPFSFFVKN